VQDDGAAARVRPPSLSSEELACPPIDGPDTIVLIHGFWVTPRSWEHWIARYEARGHRVIAPAYPGFEVEVEALNADPAPIEAVTVPQIVEHLETVVGSLDQPPILIGHSAGGVFVQLLLDHGFGAAGVAINSAPTEGVKTVPLAQVKATFPVLKNPANRHRAVGFTHEQWHYAFTNTFGEEESRALYEQRQALQVRHGHRGRGVPRAAPAPGVGELGRRSPTTPSTGPSVSA
jgi:pimeloyl-ACP methyl ester carboxylesterase